MDISLTDVPRKANGHFDFNAVPADTRMPVEAFTSFINMVQSRQQNRIAKNRKTGSGPYKHYRIAKVRRLDTGNLFFLIEVGKSKEVYDIQIRTKGRSWGKVAKLICKHRGFDKAKFRKDMQAHFDGHMRYGYLKYDDLSFWQRLFTDKKKYARSFVPKGSYSL